MRFDVIFKWRPIFWSDRTSCLGRGTPGVPKHESSLSVEETLLLLDNGITAKTIQP